MLQSIASSNTKLTPSAILLAKKTLHQQRRRLFAHGRFVGDRTFATTASNVECIDWERERNLFLNAIEENDALRSSTVYSLSMASVEGSQFPPLSRNLNKREREQLRISQTQHMGTRQVKNGGDTLADGSLLDDTSSSMAYSLSLASSINEGSVKFPSVTRSLNDREMEQLRISQDQLISYSPNSIGLPIEGLSYRPAALPQQQQHKKRRNKHPSLPRTLRDALRPCSEAIVITESALPFKVCDVNDPWVDLCGYSYAESKGKSLGSLLSGEETDTCSVTALIHQLFVHGEEATTVVTNYTKEGRKFRNRLRVGPIYDEETGDVSHFVGILKEV